jgi:predicted ATP-grasp superfamily ATP-dependent carboligase
MGNVTVERQVSLDEAAAVLRQQLGARYHVNPRRVGAHEAIAVGHGIEVATVHIDRTSGATTFRVHGGGWAASRLANELRFARRVCSTLEDAFDRGAD